MNEVVAILQKHFRPLGGTYFYEDHITKREKMRGNLEERTSSSNGVGLSKTTRFVSVEF
jgi:hypothetical protein